MPINDFFDNTCDIYYPAEETEAVGYGAPGRKVWKYNATPSNAAVPCHFGIKGDNQSREQREPDNRLAHTRKLTLPAGTTFPANCKIIDKGTGEQYTGQTPLNIRGHHVTVMLYKRPEQEAL